MPSLDHSARGLQTDPSIDEVGAAAAHGLRGVDERPGEHADDAEEADTRDDEPEPAIRGSRWSSVSRPCPKASGSAAARGSSRPTARTRGRR
jgi:hypothetical protein